MIHVAVSLLQAQSPLDRLEVVEHGLSLDAEPPTRAADDGIPRSAIPADLDRDLRGPAEGRVEAGAQSLQKAPLTGIPDRVACRIIAEANSESHGRADRGKLPNGGTPSACLQPLE